MFQDKVCIVTGASSGIGHAIALAFARLGEPDEVAELVLWMSSPRASFVTGSYYPVDAGFLAR